MIPKKRVLVQTIVSGLLVFLAASLILSPTYLSSFEANASTIGSTYETLYSTEDAYVNASSPDTNYGSETTLCVAANSEKDFTYVKFDLTSIPSGAHIISAKLELYLSDTTGSFYYYLFGGNDDAIGAYHCSDNSWTQSEITWNNSPASALSPEPTSSWSFGMSYSTGSYKSWDITADTKTAFSSGTLTEALKFQFKSESGDGQAFFHSGEGSNKPKLEVEYSMQPVAVVNLESAQDPEATDNLGFITFAGNSFSLPTDIDVVPGSYQINYRSGYTFTKWETSGGLTVSNANSATTTVTVSGGGTLRAIGNVTQLEYTYDHENAGSESQSAEYIDAVRFTPLISGQLITARFYIQYISSSLSNTFKVHVMDENRHDIINPFTRTPTSTGWSDVDLSSYDINVNTGVDFYIGMEWITNNNPRLGRSYSSTDRGWTWNGTNWQDAQSEFMIRAVTWTANPATYSLTITTTAGGSTNPVLGTHIYNAGTAVSVQASANADYLFDHWELDGTDKGNSNPYTVTMNTDQTLRALFTPRATPTPTPTSALTAEQTPTPSSSPAPSSSPSPSVSPSPSPPSSESPGPTSTPQEGYFLSKETLYAISAVTVIIVVSIAVFALRKRRK